MFPFAQPALPTTRKDDMRTRLALLLLLALVAALGALPAAADAPAALQSSTSARRAVSGARALREAARAAENEAAEAEGQADAATAPGDGDNPLREPRQPALHRVYDPETGLTCDLASECLPCPVSERDESFCRETGHRQELSCPRPRGAEAEAEAEPATERETRFRACVPPERVAPVVAVFKFEVRRRGYDRGKWTIDETDCCRCRSS